MNQDYPVSKLFETSHLAEHFYAMVKGLEGRDAVYSNPGISLRSYAVVQCTNRMVRLDESMQMIYDECESFNNDPVVRKTISDAMRERPYEIANAIMKVTGPSKQINATLHNLNQLVRVLDATENMEDEVSVNRRVQTLIELQRAIEDLSQVLSSLPIKA